MLLNLKCVLFLAVTYFGLSNTKIINEVKQSIRKFPDGFSFGAATASYQIEGAWNADGKTETIWDHLTHNNPCSVKDCSNGDIAANSYNLFKRDVEMIRELGLDHYRFSLSWTRILPTGFPDKINEAGIGQYAHPIFAKEGDFPQIMKEKVSAKSAAQGYYRSRLVEFTEEEVNMIRGSSDFIGLNHYTTYLSYRSNVTLEEKQDSDVTSYQPNSWPGSASEWLKQIPWGLHKLLTYVKHNYDNPMVIITENGFSTLSGLEDDDRISFYREYLNAMLDAIEEGCNVAGYTAWSLMDNFEWLEGYTVRFGLYEVDFTTANRTRTPRKSAFVYKEIVRSRALDPIYEPNTKVMTIDEGH
ncbi:unnamed protein product [Chilo suppressalis]|uniref:beta-glucosidase n=1 Tax=Chilo suppressalis TaxID=168631 RepID=A0ABN8LFS2_CHISP|nr:unnamed protein product [Chilo suppressalis]